MSTAIFFHCVKFTSHKLTLTILYKKKLFFAIRVMIYSTKPTTNTLTSPASVTQMFPLKLADKKVNSLCTDSLLLLTLFTFDTCEFFGGERGSLTYRIL